MNTKQYTPAGSWLYDSQGDKFLALLYNTGRKKFSYLVQLHPLERSTDQNVELDPFFDETNHSYRDFGVASHVMHTMNFTKITAQKARELIEKYQLGIDWSGGGKWVTNPNGRPADDEEVKDLRIFYRIGGTRGEQLDRLAQPGESRNATARRLLFEALDAAEADGSES